MRRLCDVHCTVRRSSIPFGIAKQKPTEYSLYEELTLRITIFRSLNAKK